MIKDKIVIAGTLLIMALLVMFPPYGHDPSAGVAGEYFSGFKFIYSLDKNVEVWYHRYSLSYKEIVRLDLLLMTEVFIALMGFVVHFLVKDKKSPD
jgi:hypothetical protein